MLNEGLVEPKLSTQDEHSGTGNKRQKRSPQIETLNHGDDKQSEESSKSATVTNSNIEERLVSESISCHDGESEEIEVWTVVGSDKKMESRVNKAESSSLQPRPTTHYYGMKKKKLEQTVTRQLRPVEPQGSQEQDGSQQSQSSPRKDLLSFFDNMAA